MQRTVAVVCNRLPYPPSGGVPRYLNEVLLAFQKSGWLTTLMVTNLSEEADTKATSQSHIEKQILSTLDSYPTDRIPHDPVIRMAPTYPKNSRLQVISAYSLSRSTTAATLNRYDLVIVACTATALMHDKVFLNNLHDVWRPLVLAWLSPLREIAHYFAEQEARVLANKIASITELYDRVVVVPSTASANELEGYVPHLRARIVTVQLGSNPSSFVATGNDLPKQRQGMTVNRMTDFAAHKSVRQLVGRWKEVTDRIEDASLLLIGPGDEPLKGTNVVRGGQLSDRAMQQQMAISRLYISFSTIESFGLAISESLREGLPVIAVRQSSAAELIEHGHNGYLIEEHTDTEFAQHVVSLLQNDSLQHRMSRNATQSVLNLTWENTVSRYIDLA